MSLTNAPKLTHLYLQLLSQINLVLEGLPLLQKIDKKYSSGTNGTFTLFILLLISILTILGLDTRVAVLAIGSYYPAIKSIGAIKVSSIVEYHRWATYWLVFCLFEIVLYQPIRAIIGFLPYYGLWRMGFYISLFHPKFDLAYKLYTLIIKPYLKRMKKQRISANRITGSPKKEEKQKEGRLSYTKQSEHLTPSRKYSENSIRSN